MNRVFDYKDNRNRNLLFGEGKYNKVESLFINKLS